MDYQFECPSCGQRISASDEWVGTEATCPTCAFGFVVPRPPESANTPISPPPSPRSRTLRIVVATVGCTLLVVAVGLFVLQKFQVKQAWPYASKLTATSGDSAAISIIEHYVSAVQWEERLALVRTPDRVRALMQDRYRNFKGPIGYEKIVMLSDYVLPEGFSAYEVTYPDKDTGTFYLEKTSAGYKIDWEATVINPLSVRSFQAQRPHGAELFRAIARLSTYYNFEYLHASATHYSVELFVPEREVGGKFKGERLHGYVEQQSEDGKALYDLLKDGEEHRLLLRLHIGLDRSRDDIVEISKFVQPGWIQKDLSSL